MAASWDGAGNEIKTELKRRRKERERWETEIILLVKRVGLLRRNCRREAFPLGWINLLVSHMTEGGGPGAGGEEKGHGIGIWVVSHRGDVDFTAALGGSGLWFCKSSN